jgi:DNA-binding beta-propeller fold protein YncE
MPRMPGRLVRGAALGIAVLGAASIAWSATGGGSNIVGPSTRIQPTGRQLEPVGKLTKLGNFPTGGALTPNGRFLWTLSTGRGINDIRIVKVTGDHAGKMVQKIRMPGLSGGIAISRDGRRAYVSGIANSPFTDQAAPSSIPGGEGDVVSVFKLKPKSGHAKRKGTIPVPPPPGSPPYQTFPPQKTATLSWPRDLALSPDGHTLLAALNLADRAAIIDTKTKSVRYVRVGHYPYGAAITSNGKYGLVTGETQGIVSVIDLATGQKVKTIQAGAHLSHPEGMAVDPKRPLAFVAIANDDQIGVINTKRLTLKRTLSLARPQGAGTTPTQVTVTKDGCDLLSADSGEDAVAIFALSRAHRCDPSHKGKRRAKPFQLVGRLPVGSYPTVATARSVNDKLAWISARGLGVGPNPHGPNPNSPNDSDDFINSFQYLPSIVRGSSGVLRFPSDKKIRHLTPKADRQIHPVNQQSAPSNTPIRANGPIKHVFFIVKENRTYDQVLGDDPRGDGDRHLTLFGKRITPNTHALVRRFPLLDHVYANSEASIDGHYWTAAGAVSDYVTKNWPQNYSGRGRPYDFGAYEVSAPPKGYIFQRALAENIPFFNYGEALAGLSPFPDKDRTAAETATNAQVLKSSDVGLNGCYDGDIAIFNPVGVSNVDVYDSSVPAGAPPTSHSRFACFRTRFQSQLVTNSVPPLNYMSLPLDHTQGVAPGKRTPNADVADNDWGLGQIVQEISHSKIWGSSLILVMEDDSQDGADHVDAHRIPALVISPYTQKGAVVHDRYDQLSFLRTMEKIIGMKPLNLAEHLSVPLYDAMTPKPRNAAPYNAIRPKVSVTATNPNTAANRRASRGLPLNALDQVPQQRLDAILWRYKHGPQSTPPPPGPNASTQDTEERDQSGDEALGHPGRVAQKLRTAFRHADGGGN